MIVPLVPSKDVTHSSPLCRRANLKKSLFFFFLGLDNTLEFSGPYINSSVDKTRNLRTFVVTYKTAMHESSETLFNTEKQKKSSFPKWQISLPVQKVTVYLSAIKFGY